MNVLRSLGTSLAIALFASAAAQAQPQVTIAHIKIVDTPGISEHELNQIAHEVEGRICPAAKLEDCIMERIRNAFQERGYFKAIVREPNLKSSTSAEKVEATVVVEPGLQYLLADLQFRFSGQPTLSKTELAPLVTAHQGEIFNIGELRQTLENLRSYYGARGYLKFTTIPNVRVDDQKHELYVTLDIMPEG